jgi:transcriptional regulator with XRE-family HTH domain
MLLESLLVSGGDMGNERLRDALLNNHQTPGSLAEEIGADRKTVERWISQDRTPYARHRRQVAALLGESESWLWPNAISQERLDATSRSRLVQLYPRRAAIGVDGFNRLFGRADTFIDILVYAALFLPEQTPGVVELLREKGLPESECACFG